MEVGHLPDDGTTTINIIGNVLEDDDEDWYVITAGDDLAADLAAGRDEFKFEAKIADGTSEYSFVVYRDDPAGVDADSCMPDADGYTEYSWFNEDSSDALHHPLPADLQACGASSVLLNDCADDTSNYHPCVPERVGPVIVPELPDSSHKWSVVMRSSRHPQGLPDCLAASAALNASAKARVHKAFVSGSTSDAPAGRSSIRLGGLVRR